MLLLKAWLGPTGSCGIDVVRFSGIAEVFGMFGIFGEECSESECTIEIGILPESIKNYASRMFCNYQ